MYLSNDIAAHDTLIQTTKYSSQKMTCRLVGVDWRCVTMLLCMNSSK